MTEGSYQVAMKGSSGPKFLMRRTPTRDQFKCSYFLLFGKRCRLWYGDMIYLLTTIGLPPGGSITVHIYTQTIYRPTQSTRTVHRTT